MRTGEGLAKETVNLGSGKSSEAPTAATTPGELDPKARISEDALLAAVRQSPGSFESNHRLGEFYFHLGRYRESIPPLTAGYSIYSDDRQNEMEFGPAH